MDKTISSVMDQDVTLVNPAVNTASEVRELLEDSNQLSEVRTHPMIEFYVSDFGQGFQKIGSRFLNKEVKAECIDIEGF